MWFPLAPCPPVGVMAVMKGNGYGHGVVPVIEHLLKQKLIQRIAVATVAEAVQLRRANIQGPIHVLGDYINNNNN